LPKQNRPLVRDGRIQVKKKRTDRSYLGAAADEAVTAIEAPPEDADIVEDPKALEAAEDAEAKADDEVALLADGPVAMPPSAPAAKAQPVTAAAPAPARKPPSRLPTAVRAIQQQGVRKRRDVDLKALARRDTEYAIHELRRIAVLATMVIVTLVILGIVLR